MLCCAYRIHCMTVPHHHHNRFTALFPGPARWAGARREHLDFVVQGKINTGRHTDHPAGRHSTRTNQCPPPPTTYCMTVDTAYCSADQSVLDSKLCSRIVLQAQRFSTQPSHSNKILNGKQSSTTCTTSRQSNLTKGRIAAALERFSRIRQVAPLCNPVIIPKSALSRGNICTPSHTWFLAPTESSTETASHCTGSVHRWAALSISTTDYVWESAVCHLGIDAVVLIICNVDISQVWLENDYSLPKTGGFGGILPCKWEAASSQSPKSTSLRRNTSWDA